MLKWLLRCANFIIKVKTGQKVSESVEIVKLWKLKLSEREKEAATPPHTRELMANWNKMPHLAFFFFSCNALIVSNQYPYALHGTVSLCWVTSPDLRSQLKNNGHESGVTGRGELSCVNKNKKNTNNLLLLFL